MVCPAISRGRCLSIRDISIYESIPHRFLGPEFAMKPASLVIVEMKLRGKLQIDSQPYLSRLTRDSVGADF